MRQEPLPCTPPQPVRGERGARQIQNSDNEVCSLQQGQGLWWGPHECRGFGPPAPAQRDAVWDAARTKIKSSYLDFTCSWTLLTRRIFFAPRKAVMPSGKTGVGVSPAPLCPWGAWHDVPKETPLLPMPGRSAEHPTPLTHSSSPSPSFQRDQTPSTSPEGKRQTESFRPVPSPHGHPARGYLSLWVCPHGGSAASVTHPREPRRVKQTTQVPIVPRDPPWSRWEAGLR